ncbi:unnamed protein product [Cercopithifilaria johnstoni]|uniref:Uncharacterized protein n=1 Tax=Cercopithifilaria johnstoni TaxID=2874296 RepID=A0A8J2M5C0_9BILA|nr:unnamed protein product [Cercopithifilaria johnstoni]
MSNWKAEIEWNDGKVAFLNIHDTIEKEGLTSIIVQESCKLDRIMIKEYFNKQSEMDGKVFRYSRKLKESVAKIISDETMKFAGNANASKKEVETIAEYLFYNDKHQYTVLHIFNKIDSILILGAVLAIIISCIMVTVEVRYYKLYQMVKNKPVRLVLTQQFLEKIQIERCNARKRGLLFSI